MNAGVQLAVSFLFSSELVSGKILHTLRMCPSTTVNLEKVPDGRAWGLIFIITLNVIEYSLILAKVWELKAIGYGINNTSQA